MIYITTVLNIDRSFNQLRGMFAAAVHRTSVSFLLRALVTVLSSVSRPMISRYLQSPILVKCRRKTVQVQHLRLRHSRQIILETARADSHQGKAVQMQVLLVQVRNGCPCKRISDFDPKSKFSMFCHH